MRSRRIDVLAFLAGSVFAPQLASSLEFTAKLDSIKVHARPGQVVTRSFQLHLAAGQAKARFHSHTEDWWQSEDGQKSFFRPPGTLAHSCGKWIRLDPVEASVEPGGTLAVRITAAVPRQAAPGGYWCVLTVDELADPLAQDAGVDLRFKASVSTGIFLFLDPVQRDVRVAAIELSAHRARITLENAGNSPVAVEGRVELYGAGRSTPVVTVPLQRTTILTEPIATRRVTIALPNLAALPGGRYMAQVVLDLGLDHDVGVQKDLVLPDDLVKGP